MFVQFAAHEFQNRQDDSVQVDRPCVLRILFEHRADVCDDVACPPGVADDLSQVGADFVDTGCLECQPVQGRFSPHPDGAHGLADLMSDGG
jgi:hypothetical protein